MQCCARFVAEPVDPQRLDPKTKKDDLIWEFGAREKDVTTSGLGLYGDLLMAQREALRA